MAKREEYADDEDVDENVYEENKREDLVDDDEMSAQEEGFMEGYEEREEKEDEVDAEAEQGE